MAALALLVAFAAAAATLDFPPLTGRVVDQAGILSQQAQDKIAAISEAVQQKTHDQLVVVTLNSLDGADIATYGYQLGRHWGIGQKGRNTGVLLIIVPGARKVRIEVGYGLEGTLTDAQSALIIENIVKPAFRRGDYDGGALAGAAAIGRVLGVDTSDVEQALSQEAQPHASDGTGAFPIVLVVIVIWLVFGRFLWPLLFLGGGWGGGRRGGGFGGGWGGGFGGGFGGGGFGGGGFSGGGGSFGGGGASGSW
ncbi:MAG TPA: TPM domain-containing protein [Rhizomicrobium sp.]|nr:TPM domain-containing protein [Rhizomicrobium sp.]